MKRLIAILAILCLLPAMATAQDSAKAWGPRVIASAGVAYSVAGPARHEQFTAALAGVKVEQLPHGAVYACYQYAATEDATWGGSGARAILVDQIGLSDFSAGVGIGFVDKIKEKPDGGKVAGLEFDALISWDASQYLDLTLFGLAADGGPNFHWMLIGGFTIKDPQGILGL